MIDRTACSSLRHLTPPRDGALMSVYKEVTTDCGVAASLRVSEPCA